MKSLSLIAIFAATSNLFADPPAQAQLMPFIENQGQVLGTENALHPEISYYSDVNGLRAFFSDNRIAHVWQRRDTVHDIDTLYRMDILFLGYNSGVQIHKTEDHRMPGLLNYFLGYLPSHVTNVKMWDEIVYDNLYQNTDLILTNTGSSLNYHFDADQSSNIGDIRMKIQGASNVQIMANGELLITTPYGVIQYDKPKGRKINSNNNSSTPVNVNFSWDGLVLSLQISASVTGRVVVDIERLAGPPNSPVLPVVNQELFWSTYFGGSSGTELHEGYLDASNNFYLAGGTASGLFPFSNSLPITFQGGWDAIVAKFAPDRHLLYGTFIGGNGHDEAWSVTSDIFGNPCFTGPTTSTNFPLCSSFSPSCNTTVQFTNSNTQSSFYVKLNNSTSGDNVLISTYLGINTFNNGGYAVIGDAIGNVYIGLASVQDPLVPIVGALNAYNQPTTSGGPFDQDGYIAKFDLNNTLVWATFIGGNAQDVITNLEVDGNDNLYVLGYSFSPTAINNCASPCTSNNTPGFFPIADPMNGLAYQQGLYQSGQCDVFIAKFTNANALEWSTMFGGGADDGYAEGHSGGIAVDDLTGSIYITSTTLSNNTVGDIVIFPASQPNNSDVYWQNVSGGLADAFIAKFNSSFELIYSSYYGGDGQDLGSDITIGHALGATIIYFSGAIFQSNYTYFPVNHYGLFYNDAANGLGQGYVVTLIDELNNSSSIPERQWASCFGTGATDAWFITALNNRMITGGWCNANLQPAPTCTGPAYCQGTPPYFGYNGCMIEFILHSCFVCPPTARLAQPIGLLEPQTVPNPTVNGKFEIVLNNYTTDRFTTVEISDAQGRLVKTEYFETGKPLLLDISGLNEGLYFITTDMGTERFYSRVVYHKE